MRRAIRIPLTLLALFISSSNIVFADSLVFETVDCKYNMDTRKFTLIATVSGDLSKINNPKLVISWTRKKTGNTRGPGSADREIEHDVTKTDGKNFIFKWTAKPGLSDVRQGRCFLRYINHEGKIAETQTRLTDWIAVNQ